MVVRIRKVEKERVRLLFPYRKERRKKVKVVIGPWEGDLNSLSSESDILVSPLKQDTKVSKRKGAFLIDGPGEYEVKGVFVTGIEDSGEGVIYAFKTEKIQTCFLPALNKEELEISQLEKMDDVHLLLFPLDPNDLPRVKWLKNVVAQIEPEIMVFVKQNGGEKEIEKFLKEMDVKNGEEKEEFSFTTSDFEKDKTKYFILGG